MGLPSDIDRSSRWRLLASGAALALGLSGCGVAGDDGVTIKGDVAGLDTLALRGDSLIANAGKAPAMFDSVPPLPAPVETGAGDGTLSVPGRDGMVGTDAGNEMSRRAQARGDSMAKAIASQLANANATRSGGDSVRGVLAFAGTEPARQVVLRQGDATISLSGMATTGLSKLVGTEIVVRGVQVTPRDVVVNSYVVRAANGVPALDGTIEESGALRLTDGSGVRRVPLPAEVRGMVGTRVWVAIKNGGAVAGGVIAGR